MIVPGIVASIETATGPTLPESNLTQVGSWSSTSLQAMRGIAAYSVFGLTDNYRIIKSAGAQTIYNYTYPNPQDTTPSSAGWTFGGTNGNWYGFSISNNSNYYSCSSAGVIYADQTGTPSSTFTPSETVRSCYMNYYGVRLYAWSLDDNVIYAYTLSTANDLSTASSTPSSTLTVTGFSRINDVAMNQLRTKLYVAVDDLTTDHYLLEYTLSTADDLSTATLTAATLLPSDLLDINISIPLSTENASPGIMVGGSITASGKVYFYDFV